MSRRGLVARAITPRARRSPGPPWPPCGPARSWRAPPLPRARATPRHRLWRRVRSTPKSSELMKRVSASGRGQPADHADAGQHEPSRTNMRFELAVLRAQRQPDADLARPLRHGIGDDAVDADHAEQERRRARDSEHHERERRAGHRSARRARAASGRCASGRFGVHRPDRLLSSLRNCSVPARGLRITNVAAALDQARRCAQKLAIIAGQ